MKVKFSVGTSYVDSRVTQVFDTVKDWGYDEGEWENMTEDQKEMVYQEWMWDNINAHWVELED